ncbi:MAG: hypothetical protein KDK50_02790 [Chlamydiia bacterium]|nr:hypothetical protein [Chlamydiia bacterium]
MTSLDNAFGYAASATSFCAAAASAYAAATSESQWVRLVFSAGTAILTYTGYESIQRVWRASHPATEKT